jgi:hypothetical protein
VGQRWVRERKLPQAATCEQGYMLHFMTTNAAALHAGCYRQRFLQLSTCEELLTVISRLLCSLLLSNERGCGCSEHLPQLHCAAAVAPNGSCKTHAA